MFNKSSKITADDYDESTEPFEDEQKSHGDVQIINLHESSLDQGSLEDSNKESTGGFGNFFSKKVEPIIEPDMPFMGPPIKYFMILDRTNKAKPVTKRILDAAHRAVADSVIEAKAIPVSDQTERIKVTSDITDRIAQKRTKKSIKLTVENNYSSIKKILNWRSIIQDMMNFNSSGVFVKKPDSIDISESRAVVTTRPNGKPDSDMW